MNDPFVVRGAESTRDLTRILERLARRAGRPRAGDWRSDVAFEHLRDDERRAVVRADVVDGEDVRVVELAGRARFLLESSQPAAIGCVRVEDQFDRDVASEAWIARAIHLAHAAGAEPADDLIGTDAGPNRNRHGKLEVYFPLPLTTPEIDTTSASMSAIAA